MGQIAYVNGRYVREAEACVSINDRGYQFADGAYEVCVFYNRRMLDEMPHLQRLMRSLRELRIATPMSLTALRLVMRQVIARNPYEDGTIYLQITRGVARRDHAFPAQNPRPALVITVNRLRPPSEALLAKGAQVITLPDERWARRDIKSISLLANVLAKQAAAEKGAREAWQLQNGMVTEGSASNSAIITKRGELVTHPEGHGILSGITRAAVLEIARQEGIPVREKAFSLQEALAAQEAFLMSTTNHVLPVTRINDTTIGTGKPGPITRKLLALYRQRITEQTGASWN